MRQFDVYWDGPQVPTGARPSTGSQLSFKLLWNFDASYLLEFMTIQQTCEQKAGLMKTQTHERKYWILVKGQAVVRFNANYQETCPYGACTGLVQAHTGPVQAYRGPVLVCVLGCYTIRSWREDLATAIPGIFASDNTDHEQSCINFCINGY
jgi:hypothetical protein